MERRWCLFDGGVDLLQIPAELHEADGFAAFLFVVSESILKLQAEFIVFGIEVEEVQFLEGEIELPEDTGIEFFHVL